MVARWWLSANASAFDRLLRTTQPHLHTHCLPSAQTRCPRAHIYSYHDAPEDGAMAMAMVPAASQIHSADGEVDLKTFMKAVLPTPIVFYVGDVKQNEWTLHVRDTGACCRSSRII